MIGVELVLVSAGTSVALWFSWRRLPETLVRPNHRGQLIPVVLGLIVIAAAAIGISIVALERAARSSRVVITGRVVTASVAIAVVFAAGLLDDLTHGGPRGLRGHLAALRDRRLSTGIWKIVSAVGAGIVVAVIVPNRSVVERALAVVLMAGATNLWNGLDVAPGRAAKAFLLAGGGVLAACPAWAVAVPVLALYGAEVPAAWLDLREHGMLGDAGANALGFAVGAGLFTVLPGWGIAIAAAAAVALNVVAETVTLSRVIEAVRPLRWFDELGRPVDPGKKFARSD
jgi:hypothetical protein